MTTSNKIILEASTFPKVDIDFMNNTHFDELVIVQNVGELVSAYQHNNSPNDSDTQEVTDALTGWLDHTHAHFSRENLLMDEVEFPMYHIHFGEHERVLNEMETIVNTWKKSHDIKPVEEYVFNLWPTWFNNHVNSMDLMTAQFAVMNGYSPNSAPPSHK